MAQRIAVVTDSNSGITQKLAKELGVFVLPMPFVINGETFFEDISLSQEAFYEKLQSDAAISTSQPAPGDILDLWDTLLQDHDAVVHNPLSAEYDGRVAVVNNQRISVTQRQSVMDAAALARAGKSAAEIKEVLEKVKFESSIYIMVDTLQYLKKGGRITPAAAAVATVLRIKPVLQIQGEKLDAFAKARNEKQARTIMLEAMRKDMENRFGGGEQLRLFVAHTNNAAAAEECSAMLRQELGVDITYCDPLSLSVSCHIGPGALAVACSKKIDRYL